MGIKLIKLNGEHPKLDYERLKESFISMFKRTCSEASIYVLNRFPVLVASESDIDILLVIVVEDVDGNYISFEKNERTLYLHNLIIPIKYVSEYRDSEITTEGDSLLIDEGEIDFGKEVTSLKYNLKRYLNNRCDFPDDVYINPLVFIENEATIVNGDLLVAEKFNFALFSLWLKNNSSEVFISYKPWRLNYNIVLDDLTRVVNQASNDSLTGYLTKVKIDKIGKELSSSNSLKDSLGQKMIMVKGKAGSGKTTELLSLCISSLKAGYNPFFLTYNKILVYDISQVIKSVVELKEINSFATVNTLHSFFYELSKRLSVLHLMSEERQKDILKNLENRIKEGFEVIKPKIIFNKILNKKESDEILSFVQNSSLDKGTIEVGIDLIHFLRKKIIKSEGALNDYLDDFYIYKKNKLSSIAAHDIFLADYYGVLESVFLSLSDPDTFHEKYKILEKADLIDLATGSADKYVNSDGLIEKEKFRTFIKRRLGGRRGKKRIVFVDESQDCHRLEKEILALIYGCERMVIANGGKEQLIRHVDLCNWEVIQGVKIQSIVKNKRGKSYRIKPQIANFCNFFASIFDIKLNLEGLDTADKGEIIFDFRSNKTMQDHALLFDELTNKGKINKCVEYESLLVLLESLGRNSDSNNSNSSNVLNVSRINEFDNISETAHFNRGKWSELSGLEGHGYQFYDATVSDKRELGLPYPNQIRLMFYESCRGLEAWSVACFSLDKFFNEKKEEEEAEKFLIEDEKGENMTNMFITNEQRKEMFAATWVLMALTRVIDTLYISIDDKDSRLGQIVLDYIKMNPRNIKVLRD